MISILRNLFVICLVSNSYSLRPTEFRSLPGWRISSPCTKVMPYDPTSSGLRHHPQMLPGEALSFRPHLGLIPPCDICVHYSNKKCFYYKVILNHFVVPLYDQIMEQDFANEKNALDVNIARNDTRFCGPNATNYEKK